MRLSQRRSRSRYIVQQSQCILAEYFSHIGSRVALPHQRLGDLREVSTVFHSHRPAPTVEVGSKPDVIHTDKLHRVIYVLDDLLPAGFRRRAKLFGDFLAAFGGILAARICLLQLSMKRLTLLRGFAQMVVNETIVIGDLYPT